MSAQDFKSSEKYIERKFCEEVALYGGKAYKFVSPNNAGVPDRLVVMHGEMYFVEFKSTGKRPTKLQNATFASLASRGAGVYVVDNITDALMIARGINHFKGGVFPFYRRGDDFEPEV